jgi:hypothetical protein
VVPADADGVPGRRTANFILTAVGAKASVGLCIAFGWRQVLTDSPVFRVESAAS